VMYSWASRDRLAPMRMVWWGDGEGRRFEIAKYYRPRLRKPLLVGQHHEGRVDLHHWGYALAAGRLGEWPVFNINGNRRPKRRPKRRP
jgi:hypothetical protein